MKVFYDTEFVEDGRTIDLISIGMVAEDGREYYAVSEDIEAGITEKKSVAATTGYKIRRNLWLMENVVPHLPLRADDGITRPMQGSNEPPNFWLDMSSAVIKRREVIKAEVREFILAGGDPELWAWYGAYDHVVLAQLFGRMISLPEGVPMWTNDLRQETQRYGNPKLPKQDSAEHHALADARWVRDSYLWLQEHYATAEQNH